MKVRLAMLTGVLLLAVSAIWAASPESSIEKGIGGLRDVPDAKRPAATVKIAEEIRTLPAGMQKLKYADALVHLSTEGDPGHATLEAVAETLAQSLKETPLPAGKDGAPVMPYMDLAKLERYEGVTVDFKDPQMDKATAILAANDAEIAKADFTLKDLKNRTYTLSALRGKIVVVNFWATWCPPCRKEMPALDAIYTRFGSQVVVLSITDEDPLKVSTFIGAAGYHPPVLLDPQGNVKKAFHVDGIPKTFVFDRDGKLVTQSIDMRTPQQFLAMLTKAGMHP